MRSSFPALVLAILTLSGCAVTKPGSHSQEGLKAEARQSLNSLLAQNPNARIANNQAIAVLVFPSVIKAGFMFGAQTGNGVLFERGHASGIFNTSAVSYGLQAGIQDYGYALFFMNQRALDFLESSGGLDLGVGPSLVVADKGFAKTYTAGTLTQDIYAFTFDQAGVMAGLGLTGSKITRISP